MENNEMSFEALYSEALGISNSNNTYVDSQSSEGFDGFYDALEVEIARSFENLAFLDTYTSMQQKNSAEMIRMCKKLSVNYGLKSGVNEKAAVSIESLCRVRSMEADAAAADAGAAPKVADGDKPKEDGQKKENIFKRIWAGIKKIWGHIKEFFKKIWAWIQKNVISRFKKATKNATAEEIKAEEAAVASNSSNGPKPTEGQWIITSGTINIGKVKTLVKEIVSVQKMITSSEKTLDKSKKDALERAIKVLDSKMDKFDPKENVASFFDLGLAVKNDRTIKMAIQWAAKADNINHTQDIIKQIDPVIKELEKLAAQCEAFADKMSKVSVDYSTEKGKDLYEGKKIMVDAMRGVTKECNRTREKIMRIVKAFPFSQKLHFDMTEGKKAKRKAIIEKNS